MKYPDLHRRVMPANTLIHYGDGNFSLPKNIILLGIEGNVMICAEIFLLCKLTLVPSPPP